MKKFLVIAICVITALNLLSLVSCTKAKSPTAATATVIPSLTPTNTPVPLEVTGFEDNTMGGWSVTSGWNGGGFDNGGNIVNAQNNVDGSHLIVPVGILMVELPFSFSNAGGSAICSFAKSETVTPLPNFQGKSISVPVWIPASLTATATGYEFEIYFTGGTGPTTYYSNPVLLSTAIGFKWNTFTYAIPASGAAYTDAATVQAYGFELLQNGGPALPTSGNSDVIFVDNIVVQ